MKIARVLAVLLITATALFAQSDTWKYVGRAESVKSYYDTSSLKKTGDYNVQAWIKIVPVSEEDRKSEAEHRQKRSSSYDYDDYAYTVTLSQNDCPKTRTRPLITIDYTSKGVPIHTHQFEQPSEWYYPPPGSIGLSLLQSICVDAYPPKRAEIDRLLRPPPAKKPKKRITGTVKAGPNPYMLNWISW